MIFDDSKLSYYGLLHDQPVIESTLPEIQDTLAEIMQILILIILSGAKIRIYFDIISKFLNAKSLQKLGEHEEL